MIQSPLLSKIPSLRHGFNARQDPSHPEGALVWLPKQTHSDRWYEVAPEGELPAVFAIEADAVVSRRPSQAIGIRTADCMPLLFSAVHHKLVAAVHAGRKGTEAGISEKLVSWLMREQGIAGDQLVVSMGPCIHRCCYEMDLVAENRKQLLAAGVHADHIDLIDHCTRCEGEDYHSYRRDGEAAGRQISWIMLR